MKGRSFSILRNQAIGCRWLAGLLAVLIVMTAAPQRPAMAQEPTEYGAILAFVAVLVALVFSFADGGLATAIHEAFKSVMRQLNELAQGAHSDDIDDELEAISNVVGGLEATRGLTRPIAPQNFNDRLDEALQMARRQRNAVIQRLTAAAALCGNGVLDVRERCDPTVTPSGCNQDFVCDTRCTCDPVVCSVH